MRSETYASFKREYKTYTFHEGLQERVSVDTRFLFESNNQYYTTKNNMLE
jgi:hypothetical protein